MNAPCPIITRPYYAVTTVADALRADWRGHHLSEKIDGVWTVRSFGNSTATGETKAGKFYGFDIVNHEGQDVSRCAWRDRGAALIDCAARYGFSLAKQGHGAEFIEAILATGEGVVAKPFEAPFGMDWTKIKRVETFDLRVAEIHPYKQSIRLVSEAGEDRGWCPAKGGKVKAKSQAEMPFHIPLFSKSDKNKDQ